MYPNKNKIKQISFLQFTNHRALDPPVTQYMLDGLYPNSLYQIWVAAKSKRGEGATTPALTVRTEQYCKLFVLSVIFFNSLSCQMRTMGECVFVKNIDRVFVKRVLHKILKYLWVTSHFYF